MTTEVGIKPITPKQMQKQVFRDAWDAVLDVYEDKLTDDFEETVETFDSEPVVQSTDRKRAESGRFLKAGGLYRAVFIRDEIYFYLARGTKVRWALMSSDWRSKTKPRRIRAGPGRGRVVVAGKRAMQARGIRPKPGIKARNFDFMIAKRRRRPFAKDVRKATRRAANRLFR